MKKCFISALAIGIVFTSMAVLQANTISLNLNVDSAPNAYGSPDWAPWKAAAWANATAGTFTNMENGSFPGQLLADPYDEIVYSTGDGGRRLHWVYWIPNTTVAELEGNFEVRIIIDWDGVDYTYDWGNGSNAFTTNLSDGWVQPGSWEDYDDGTVSGVIGTFGHAWWATDNDAPPMSTSGNDYDETDQADIDALRLDVLAYQTHATGEARLKVSETEWQTESLRVDIAAIPEPTTFVIWGVLGILALCAGGSTKRFF